MGSKKPEGWPERTGGLHLFCSDKDGCRLRWKRIGTLATRYH